MAEITDVLTKLLERTNENKISWKTTVDEATFVAVIGNLSVAVSPYFDSFDEDIRLQILNREGEEVDRFDATTIGSSSITSHRLDDLYKKARRVALGVDAQLDELLQELN